MYTYTETVNYYTVKQLIINYYYYYHLYYDAYNIIILLLLILKMTELAWHKHSFKYKCNSRSLICQNRHKDTRNCTNNELQQQNIAVLKSGACLRVQPGITGSY